MNWKVFWVALAALIGGLAAMVLLAFVFNWVATTFGFGWAFGGGTFAFIVFMAAIAGMAAKDSTI